MAEPVVNIAAKDVQEEHIADNVSKVAVQKGVTDKLPQSRVPGSKHKAIKPGTTTFRNMYTYL
jgi:hypothetical protein